MGNVDLWFELEDPDLLVKWMRHRGMTVRGLAAEIIVKDRVTGRPKPLSYGMIGQLRTGAVRTCSPSLAAQIEKALDAPPGFLFQPRKRVRKSAA